MYISIFEDFGALNSKPVFDAIKLGLQNLNIEYTHHDPHADVAIIWSVLWKGRMSANRDIWNYYREQNRPIIVAEVGLINRGVTWKLCIHHNNTTYYVPPIIPGRAEKLHINLKPWRIKGENILIVTQQTKSEQWIGQPEINEWISEKVSSIRKYTKRSIIVRPHPRQRIKSKDYIIVPPKTIVASQDRYNFLESLENTWAVVNWSSSPGVESIINGIPAFVGPTSLAASVGNLDLSNIENPHMPDRTQWVDKIAHTEWTIEEIATGYPLEQLLTMCNLPYQQPSIGQDDPS